MRRVLSVGCLAVAVLVAPMVVAAATYDVAIQHADVTFVPQTFFVGDAVRVYATVKNVGDRDVQGNVFFSENGVAIGTPPPFSARAGGLEEEVWVEWQPAVQGERQLFVKIVTAPETRDEVLSNNEMIVNVFVDADTDGDGIGNREDGDDDGDGLPDVWEEEHGLNPRDASDAQADPDRDGRTTILEYREGTDPFSPPAPPVRRGGGSSIDRTSSSGTSARDSSTGTSGSSASGPDTPLPASGVDPQIAGARVQGDTVAQAIPTDHYESPTAPRDTVRSGSNEETVTRSLMDDDGSVAVSGIPSAGDDLQQLLGRKASPWKSGVPMIAGAVAVGALAGLIILIRRSGKDEEQR